MDSFVHLAASFNFEDEAKGRFSRKTWYLSFMPCRHTFTSTSSSTIRSNLVLSRGTF